MIHCNLQENHLLIVSLIIVDRKTGTNNTTLSVWWWRWRKQSWIYKFLRDSFFKRDSMNRCQLKILPSLNWIYSKTREWMISLSWIVVSSKRDKSYTIFTDEYVYVGWRWVLFRCIFSFSRYEFSPCVIIDQLSLFLHDAHWEQQKHFLELDYTHRFSGESQLGKKVIQKTNSRCSQQDMESDVREDCSRRVCLIDLQKQKSFLLTSRSHS